MCLLVEGEQEFLVEFGTRLAEARRKAGKTQEWLSQTLELSRTSVTNIERGRQTMTVYAMAVAARALDVDHSSLIPPPRPSSKQLSDEEQQWVETLTRDEDHHGSKI